MPLYKTENHKAPYQLFVELYAYLHKGNCTVILNIVAKWNVEKEENFS